MGPVPFGLGGFDSAHQFGAGLGKCRHQGLPVRKIAVRATRWFSHWMPLAIPAAITVCKYVTVAVFTAAWVVAAATAAWRTPSAAARALSKVTFPVGWVM